MNSYFNELACQCFTNLMCKIWCGADGMTLNPVDGCSCITIEEEKNLYPDWATPKDIDYAKRLGEQERERKGNILVVHKDGRKGENERKYDDDDKNMVDSFTDLFYSDRADRLMFKAAMATVPLAAAFL